MSLCLMHPEHGYYMKRNVLGKSGDFITSPEISQIFGELIAIWYILRWMAAGRPPRIRLVEFGPGKGTLLDDMLRVFKQRPEFWSNLHAVQLVEASPVMRALTESKIATHAGPKIEWYDAIEDVPIGLDAFTIVTAHEFFDALPAHVFEKREDGFHELMIDLVEPSESSAEQINTQPSLRYVASPTKSPMPAQLDMHQLSTLPLQSKVELSPMAFNSARLFAELISTSKYGGCGLIIDYGSETLPGDTFRAFQNHNMVHPLQSPGDADLTTDVDFSAIKAATSSLVRTHPILTQADFLIRMGFHERLKGLLAKAASDERRVSIADAASRLINRGQRPNLQQSERVEDRHAGMGNQYLVMGLTKDVSGPTEQQAWPFISADELK
ncbi:DUF185-domain-containing protein [Sistotremastrum niveocremeum HHB9708]|uniref:Protein arginine methyltransferase NDUFAF7 n=2 Tax=Sistotremastraceae TaxID=3402574 RepID=A0A164TFV7_9AGAM|nr:DUF185-domain-containing protein [Sistotremastrum niveocremeum HHB9708]KZT41243.1 DUF185-domain-containing protein [Sistotremastrum suecicum HHB10207 ss-3]